MLKFAKLNCFYRTCKLNLCFQNFKTSAIVGTNKILFVISSKGKRFMEFKTVQFCKIELFLSHMLTKLTLANFQNLNYCGNAQNFMIQSCYQICYFNLRCSLLYGVQKSFNFSKLNCFNCTCKLNLHWQIFKTSATVRTHKIL